MAEYKNNADEKHDEEIESVPIYRKKRLIIPLFIIIIIGVIAWYWYVSNKGYISTDDAFIDADRATVSSKILGRILTLNGEEGDTIHSGDVLVKLDSTDLKAQIKQFSASTTSSTESITLAKVMMERAQEDYDRAKEQYQNNISTKEQYDHALKELERAKAEYNIALTKPAITKAQQELIETQLKNSTIYAPLNGIIGKKWVLEGDVIQPGQPVYTIFDNKNIWVTAQFEETKLRDLNIGDQVEISVDAYPDAQLRGKLIQIGSNTASQFSLIPPNNASGNFTKVTQRVPVKISIENGSSKYSLLPGMSVEVRVKEKTR